MTREEQAKNKVAYRDALEALWGDGKGMVDYCMKQAYTIANVNGRLLPIEKQHIETRFCFGYSDCGQGEDYLTAIRRADNARNNAEYFKWANLKDYTRHIEALANSPDALALCNDCDKESPICALHAFRRREVLDAVGGSAKLEDLKGAIVKVKGRDAYILTDEDRATIRDAYEQAAKAHEKRVDAYLKRYGTSKVKAWTYWMDD